MTDSAFEHPRKELTADHRRQVARLAAYHFLNTASLIARAITDDLVTALTFLAITRSNVRELATDPTSALAFAGLDTVPPDDLRRAVSVYAVARELGMPYETIRRHVRKLRNAGIVESGPDGLTAPSRVFASEGMIKAVEDNWLVARALISEAAAAGLIPPGAHPPPAPDVRRQVVRLSIAYFLKSLTVIGRALEQDALSTLVLLAIGRGNLREFVRRREAGAVFRSLAAIPPDELRRPVSVYAVSKALVLPYETTRRYALRLIEEGWVERKPGGGLVVPTSVVARPGVIQGVVEFADATEAYLHRLLELGVPTEPLEPGASPAAG